jgi:N-methylhydantoinase A
MLQLSFDIGGTFTDIILFDPDNRKLDILKVPTTSREPARAVIDALLGEIRKGKLNPAEITAVLHATTVATNAILERKGGRIAVITTEGFRDVLLMGRQKRYDTNNLHLSKSIPLVQRAHIYEVSERMAFDGTIVTPLDMNNTERVIEQIKKGKYDSIAVVFLHSYANSSHEDRVGELLRGSLPDCSITLSSSVSPKYREYERTSTTVASAYVKPLVDGYLTSLSNSLREIGIIPNLSIMQSNGGLVSPEVARHHPIRIVESGPAAGVLMCEQVGREEGFDHVITFDMGGTTAKLGAIDNGVPSVTPTYEVDAINYTKGSGLPLNITAIEMIEIGAGGGSLARTHMGTISVGPHSAGAEPGPICYGRGGTQPTITDANLALGYLDPNFFNGGAMKLNKSAALAGIDHDIAKPLGISLEEAAWGIHTVANANMERAMRIVSIDRGRNPRHYALVAFGGAGPLHASRLAHALGIPKVIVPYGAGVGSALGLLFAEQKIDITITRIVRLDGGAGPLIASVFEELQGRVVEELRRISADGAVTVRRSSWMRHVGQGYEIRVDLPDGTIDDKYEVRVREAFYSAYRREYGYIDPKAEIEATDWYVVATLEREQEARSLSVGIDSGRGVKYGLDGERRAYFPELGGSVPCRVIDRYTMKPDLVVEGPALIEERESTTVILPSDIASLSNAGNLIIEINGRK